MVLVGVLLVLVGCAVLWLGGGVSALAGRDDSGHGSWLYLCLIGCALVAAGLSALVLR